MNCGANEDDFELLDAGPTAAPAKTCGSGKLRSGSTCGQGCDNSASNSCKRDQKDAAVEESLVDAGCPSLACMKCKTARAVVMVRQREPLCQTCLEAGVSGKVRSLKSNKLLLPGDHVALAFSGGFSSQTLLCNVLGMRKHAATPRKERGKIEFELSVVHIDEGTAHGLSAAAAEAHWRAVEAAARRCGAGGPAAAIHVVPLSDVFLWLDGPEPQVQQQQRSQHSQPQRPPSQPEAQSAEGGAAAAHRPGDGDGDVGWHDGRGEGERAQQRLASRAGASVPAAANTEEEEAREAREARLQALLQSVPDATGREDLLRHLRTGLLAAVAAGLGATKLLRSDTATALAARVISDTAKGRGYSLPGGIQLLDARGVTRGQPAVLQPMREVTLKEAVFFCRLRQLQPVQLPYSRTTGERRSVNALAASFVDSLQANLPSTIFTILRTAAALKPFPFNALEALVPPAPAAAAAPAVAAATAAGEPVGCPAASPGAAADAGVDAGRADGELSRSRCGGAGAGLARGDSGIAAPCCALCRAPLTRREREAIAAAAAAAAGRCARARGQRLVADEPAAMESPHVGRGVACAGAGRCSPSPEGVAASTLEEKMGALAVAEEEEEGQDMEEMEAPFCTSCRSQILFTPEQSAGTNAEFGTSSLNGAFGFGSIAGSKALALLPAAFR